MPKFYTPIDMNNLQVLNLQIHNSATGPGGTGNATASAPGTAGPYSAATGGSFYYYSGVTGGNAKTLQWSDGTNWFSIFKFDNANTAWSGVLRDGSGNFSAGTITAALTGNATTASTLQTARNFSITGKATAGATAFDGSAAIALSVTALSVVPGDIALTSGQFIVGNGSNVGSATAKNAIPISGFAAATADVDMGTSYKIVNLADPVNPQDAATKNYVDSQSQGLTPLASCKVATTANLVSSYNASTKRITLTSVGAISVDGVSLAVSDRVLVKDQTTQTQNGIYTVITVGDAYTAAVLQRATDFDSSAEAVRGAFTFISQGTTWSGTSWVMNAVAPVTLDTTNITWAQFSSAGVVTAGNGLTKVGNTIHFATASNYTVGDLWYAGSASGLTTLSAVATGNALISGGVGAAPSWGKIGLSTHVTGTLSIGNGGTGLTAVTTNGVAIGGSGAFAFTSAFAAGQILLGNGTGVPTATSVTGDVTISSAGATTIASNAVTYAKFQQVAANSLVGNPTGALTNSQAITLGSTLSFSAGALQTSAITGDVTTTANSFATTITANAVTYAKLQQVAANSIVGNPTGVLANATGITLGATLAFSAGVLQTAAHTGDVTTAANSFATTIANNAVTYAKFQQVAGLSVVGNGTASTANATAITGTANQVLVINNAGTSMAFSSLNLASSAAVTGVLPYNNGGTGQSAYAAGDMVYASAINTLSKLTIGSSGLVLTVSGGLPAWTQLNLNSSSVTGILQAGNGGTGSAYAQFVASGAVVRSHTLPDRNSTLATQASGTFTGDNATTTFTATHNFNSKNVCVQLYDSNDNVVWCDIKSATVNTVTFTFSVAPSNVTTYRWVVVGA